jgi:hypothetical protein
MSGDQDGHEYGADDMDDMDDHDEFVADKW